MKIKIVVVVLLIVGIILITLGVMPLFSSNVKEKSKCFDDLCIENLQVSFDESLCYVNADIKNDSNLSIEDRYINIILEFADGFVRKDTYQIYTLNVNEKLRYESHFSKKELSSNDKVINFKIENSSEEDIEEFNSYKETDFTMG